MSKELFGPSVKNLLQSDPPAISNEHELLDALVKKVGPFADKNKLQYHIRVSAGKIHWAVNSYFRSILAVEGSASSREDFDSKPNHAWQLTVQRAATAAGQHNTFWLADSATAGPDAAAGTAVSADSQQQPSVATAVVAGGAADAGLAQVSLDVLPINVLESIMLHLDVETVLCAACTCKSLYRAAQAERIWRCLFTQHWGSAVFPTSKHSSSSSKAAGAGNRAPAHALTTDTSSNYDVGGANVAIDVPAASGSVARVVRDQAAVMSPTGVAMSLLSARVAAPDAAARPPVPMFDTADSVTAAAAQLGASISSSLPAAVQATAQPQSQLQLQPPLPSVYNTAASRSSNRSFVSRWTGSYLPPKPGDAAVATTPCGFASIQQVSGKPSSPCRCSCHKHQQQKQQKGPSVLCCGSCCAWLPQQAPAGSWKAQYKQQHSYQAARRCPKCGDASIVPIVYGFPSAPLLAGMGSKRLVLGGDHLIEACHVWVCSGCRSCYRYFPYTDVHLWLQDDEEQQRLDHARAAVGRGGGRGSIADGYAQAGGQLQLPGEEEAAAAGMPRYTYEL